MLDQLPAIPLFTNLDPAQIELLKSAFEEYNCSVETTVFKQGDHANYLYILIKGEVAIHYKPYDGSSIILTRLRSGDVFGWSAVVGSSHYSSSIISESNLEAVRIRRNELRKLIQNHPETGRMIVDRLADIVSPRWKNARAQVQAILNSD
jgi:CRP-like cAMP-binding protein